MIADFYLKENQLRFSLVDLNYQEFTTLINAVSAYYNSHLEKNTINKVPSLRPLVDELYFMVEEALIRHRDNLESSGDLVQDARRTVEIKDFLDKVVSYNAKKRST